MDGPLSTLLSQIYLLVYETNNISDGIPRDHKNEKPIEFWLTVFVIQNNWISTLMYLIPFCKTYLLFMKNVYCNRINIHAD